VTDRKRLVGLSLGLATAGVLLAAGLAGCGGSNATASSTPTPGATPSGQQALAAYVSCLQQHGVNIQLPSGRPSGFPSGFRPSDRPTARPTADRSPGAGGLGGFGGLLGNNGQPPAGVDQATWDAAQQACASVRPSLGAGGRRRDNGANAAYLNCLRDHGLTASAGVGRLNTADPTIAAAIQACAPLRPSPAASG
jgi:hypothetical protein